MSPASAPNESGKVYPNRVLEDQDVEMQPIVLGPAPFSSPDPETDGIRMLPLEDGSSASEEASVLSGDAKEMKAADFKAAVEGAQTQEELDAVQEVYDASGKEYSTVDDAFAKRQEELNEAAEGNGDGDGNGN